MTHSPIPGTVIVSCALVAGCDRTPGAAATPPPHAAKVSATPSTVRLAPESDSIRATLRAAGFQAPPIEAFIDFPRRKLIGFRVAGKDAIKTWEMLRSLTDQTGLYPLIVTDERGNIAELLEMEPAASPEECLAAAAECDVSRWLKFQHDDRRAAAIESGVDYPPRAPDVEAEPVTDYSVPTDIASGRFLREVWVLLLPTKLPWQVFAHLGYGNWNDYPDAHVHVAIHKCWFDHYGAEVVGISSDVIEMRVSRRPGSEQEAHELAMEQYAYCGDIVDQGTEAVDVLARTLLVSNIWFFWWD